jgi:hypothetical protein
VDAPAAAYGLSYELKCIPHESSGLYNQNQFAVNINLRANKYLSLTGLRRHNAIDERSEFLAS